MSDKIKAAAEGRYPLTRDLTEQSIANYKRMAFIAGAEYFRKESGVEELREAVENMLRIMDGNSLELYSADKRHILEARAALSKSDLFFNDKNLKDGKE